MSHHLRNLLLGLLIILVGSSIASAATYVIASDIAKYNNSGFNYTSSHTYAPLKNITITSDILGTQRIQWNFYSGNFGTVVYTRLYKNGVAVGTEHSTTTEVTAITEDISESWNVGDVLGIYGYSLSTYVVNGFLYMQYTNNSPLYGTVYTVVDGVNTPVNGAEVRLWLTNGTGNSSSYFTRSSGTYYFIGVQAGTYYLQAIKGDEYDPSATEILTLAYNESREKDLRMGECTSQYNCYANVIYPVFTVWNNTTGKPIEGIDVIVTEYGSSDTVVHDTTGTDGQIVLKLLKSKRYNVTTYTGTNGTLNATWTGYPTQSSYVIPLGSGISGTQGYNGTAWTNTTSPGTAGGISNFTSTYLTSTLGIGLMGQGILVGITAWFVVGAAGGIATLAVLFAYVYLGIISMVSLIVMAFTMISIYILRGKI